MAAIKPSHENNPQIAEEEIQLEDLPFLREEYLRIAGAQVNEARDQLRSTQSELAQALSTQSMLDEQIATLDHVLEMRRQNPSSLLRLLSRDLLQNARESGARALERLVHSVPSQPGYLSFAQLFDLLHAQAGQFVEITDNMLPAHLSLLRNCFLLKNRGEKLVSLVDTRPDLTMEDIIHW